MLARREHLLSGRDRRWEVPCVVTAKDGRDFWIDPAGDFWRALTFIRDAEPCDTIGSVEEAREVGFALGVFHALISDLPLEGLYDTLEGFHITPRYLRHYDEVIAGSTRHLSPEERHCLRFVSDRRVITGILEDAREQGTLRLRPIHGDPKANNVMRDADTGRAVGVVDLDTVKPGLVHYDVGDCLRSCCNPLGEETERWEDVWFDADLCKAVLVGYSSMAEAFLSPADYEHLFEALRLIAFELGLRFFTDHLEGNVYFRTGREGHNLARALVQFRLAESIESQDSAIRLIIRDLR
jgi:Ser/Thr protein kinase RdoA (MazF antagonist)